MTASQERSEAYITKKLNDLDLKNAARKIEYEARQLLKSNDEKYLEISDRLTCLSTFLEDNHETLKEQRGLLAKEKEINSEIEKTKRKIEEKLEKIDSCILAVEEHITYREVHDFKSPMGRRPSNDVFPQIQEHISKYTQEDSTTPLEEFLESLLELIKKQTLHYQQLPAYHEKHNIFLPRSQKRTNTIKKGSALDFKKSLKEFEKLPTEIKKIRSLINDCTKESNKKSSIYCHTKFPEKISEHLMEAWRKTKKSEDIDYDELGEVIRNYS